VQNLLVREEREGADAQAAIASLESELQAGKERAQGVSARLAEVQDRLHEAEGEAQVLGGEKRRLQERVRELRGRPGSFRKGGLRAARGRWRSSKKHVEALVHQEAEALSKLQGTSEALERAEAAGDEARFCLEEQRSLLRGTEG